MNVKRLSRDELRQLIRETMYQATAVQGASYEDLDEVEGEGSINMTEGWAKLAVDVLLDFLDDPDVKERLVHDIDNRSSDLGDDAYYPSRIEDVESTAADAARLAVSHGELQSQLALMIEQIVSKAIRRAY